jgi:hypothetical protein
MNGSISDKILRRIRAKRRGWVFTAKDFIDLCPRNTIDQALYRLAHKSIIRKLSTGIYDFPRQHKILGNIAPAPDAVARAIAVQAGSPLYPSGATCSNLLGLSTQVPAKAVYLTPGASKKKLVGNSNITLKHNRFTFFNSSNKAMVILQALLYIGKHHIDQKIVDKCSKQLNNKDKKHLKKMIPSLPSWITPIINQISA